MSDRPEISQDLARKWGERCRTFIDATEKGNYVDYKPLAETVKELDALEKPPDPAEVAARDWFSSGYRKGTIMEDTFRRALAPHMALDAERDKAVKELSDGVELWRHQTNPVVSDANARVRRLFGLDKEKPPDPAEAAAKELEQSSFIEIRNAQATSQLQNNRLGMVKIIRKHHAPRDKAVKELGIAVNAFLYGDGSQYFPQEFRIVLINAEARVHDLYPEWDKEIK